MHQVRAVGPDGAPVVGALATWTADSALEVESLGQDLWQLAERWGSAPRAAAVSGDLGILRFDEVPESLMSGPSVLWVTAAGLEAVRVRLAEGDRLPEEVSFGRRHELRVRVLDEAGEPVPSIVVQHYAEDVIGGEEGSKGAPLVRSLETDGSGEARFSPARGWQWFLAEDSKGQRAAWYGEPQGRVELRLAATFRVNGVIDVVEGEPEEPWRFEAQAIDMGSFVPLGGASLARDSGTFRIDLPAIPGEELLCRLTGAGFVPAQEYLPMPAAGATVSVRFVMEPGFDVSVLVTDTEDTPIEGARVALWWTREGRWNHVSARTAASGLVVLRGLVAEPLWARVSADGFVSKVWKEPWALKGPPARPIRIVLDKGGSIAGRVLYREEPVKDFEVVIRTHDRAFRETVKPDGLNEGTFHLEAAPIGEVLLVARAKEHGPSKLRKVFVEAGQRTEVELSLQDGIRGRGRAIDAVSGERISGASARVFILDEEMWVAEAGDVHRTDAEGEFEVDELVRGVNGIRVQAEGYGDGVGRCTVGGNGPVDVGAIRLPPLGDLRVHVRARSPQDLEGATMQLSGPVHRGLLDVPPDGNVVFEDVPPGLYNVLVRSPSSPPAYANVDLYAGRPMDVQIDLMPSDEVDFFVELVPPPGQQIPTDARLDLYRADDSFRNVTTELPFPPSGRLAVSAGDAEWISVECVTLSGKVLAFRPVRVDDVRGQTVFLRISDQGFRIHVIDSKGNPASGAEVTLRMPGDLAYGYRVFTGDASGWVQVPFLFEGTLLADVACAGWGFACSVPFQAPEEGGAVELVLDATARVEITVLDRDTPLVGEELALLVPETPYSLVILEPTDARGRVLTPPLVPGDYDVILGAEGVWAVRETLAVRPGDQAVEFQVRRLGSVRVQVRSATDVPVEGARVELRSVEFATDVADWVAARKVAGPAGGFVTGEDGAVLVRALPNGPYTLRVTLPDGVVLEGEAAVPPAAVGEALVRRP